MLCEHSIIYRFAILFHLDHGKEFRWPGQAAVMRREDKVCAQGASLSVPFSRGRSFFCGERLRRADVQAFSCRRADMGSAGHHRWVNGSC